MKHTLVLLLLQQPLPLPHLVGAVGTGGVPLHAAAVNAGNDVVACTVAESVVLVVHHQAPVDDEGGGLVVGWMDGAGIGAASRENV